MGDPSRSRALIWSVEISGLIIVILTLIWICQWKGGFGGRGNPQQEYYWHVFLMIFGFIFCFGNSLLTFRLLPDYPKPTLKLIHLGLNLLVIICAILGVFFIIDVKISDGDQHFHSFHSWIGMITIILLIAQFIIGSYTFLSTKAPQALKEKVMPWHVKCGIALFLLGALTVLTRVPHAESTFELILINLTGILIIVFCLLVLHLLSDNRLKYGNRLS